MSVELNTAESGFVRELLAWDRRRRSLDWLLCNLLLALGGLIIVVAGGFTLGHRSDHVVWTMTVPGFLLGLLFLVLYVVGERRIRDRRTMVGILKKL